MPAREFRKRDRSEMVVLGKTTSFAGTLKFNTTIKIQGNFKGSIDATGDLIVDKEAVIDAVSVSVNSLTVYGNISGAIVAVDKVDMMSGSKVRGDVSASRLRIADGVLFEGKCKMTNVEKDIEIFYRPTEEIKSELLRSGARY